MARLFTRRLLGLLRGPGPPLPASQVSKEIRAIDESRDLLMPPARTGATRSAMVMKLHSWSELPTDFSLP